MPEKLIRTYQKHDVQKIKEHLLIYGDLAGACAKCNAMNLKLETHQCPECKTEFKFISFRQPKTQNHNMTKIHAQRPSMTIVDFDDYKRILGASKAEDFFK